MRTSVLREELKAKMKAAGFNSKKVSVSVKVVGYSDSIRMTIKDSSVDEKKVREIGESFRHIDRCESSGEILSGGNTYLHIGYSDSARDEIYTKYQNDIQKAIEKLKDTKEGYGVTLLDDFTLFQKWKDVARYKVFHKGYFINEVSGERELSMLIFSKANQSIN